MSFAALLKHVVRIERQVDTGDEDEYLQPVREPELSDPIRAAIQPKNAREVALLSQAGAEVSDHTIYLRPVHLTAADAIVHDASDCPVEPDIGDVTFQISGIRNASGLGHHLEVDARLVGTGASTVAETGS